MQGDKLPPFPASGRLFCYNGGMKRNKRKGARKFAGGASRGQFWNLLRAAPEFPGPLWAWFWPLLAAGFALRVVAALGGNFFLRHDEDFQILEQAHRLVWGYGFVPWEFGVGARNWLTVLPTALMLTVCKMLGLESQAQYAEFVEIAHGALSMSVPVGMFVFARNYYGEKAARAALLLGCFWHDVVLKAPHALSEFYAAYLLFAALALMSRDPSRARALTVGLLLGFALVLRPHYGLAIVGAAAAWVFALLRRAGAAQVALTGILGGSASVLVFLAADWIAWGEPGRSLRMYFLAEFKADASQILTDGDRRGHLINLAVVSGGAFLAALAWGLARWRRHILPIALALPTLALHIPQSAQVFPHIFVIVLFLLLIVADETAGALAVPKRRLAGAAMCALLLLVSVAGFAGKIPRFHKTRDDPHWGLNYFSLFHQDPHLAARRFISRLPAEEVGGVIVQNWLDGGYYRLHHKVPMYDVSHHEHAELLQGRDWRTVATHAIVQGDLDGMELLFEAGVVKVYKTGAKPSPPLPGYGTDVYHPLIIRGFLNAGVLDAPPPKFPLPQ